MTDSDYDLNKNGIYITTRAQKYVKEFPSNTSFSPTERHSVVEYGVKTSDYPTIDSVREKFLTYIAEFKDTERMKEYCQRTIGRRILFCPTYNIWHIVGVFDTAGINQSQLGGYFDWANSIGFKTAFHIRTTRGDFYNELQAEADGCIKIIEQRFNDEQWDEFNMDAVSDLLSKIVH